MAVRVTVEVRVLRFVSLWCVMVGCRKADWNSVCAREVAVVMVRPAEEGDAIRTRKGFLIHACRLSDREVYISKAPSTAWFRHSGSALKLWRSLYIAGPMQGTAAPGTTRNQ